jgi:hypothetical protein
MNGKWSIKGKINGKWTKLIEVDKPFENEEDINDTLADYCILTQIYLASHFDDPYNKIDDIKEIKVCKDKKQIYKIVYDNDNIRFYENSRIISNTTLNMWNHKHTNNNLKEMI